MAKKGTIFLNLIKSINPKKIKLIVNSFGEIDDIFSAPRDRFRDIPSLEENDIDKILDARNTNALDQELERINKEKIATIDIYDEQYPALLREISHPPIVLYVKGDLDILGNYILAIVGTRMPTIYGLSVAEEFSMKLASLGITIVSGLARGIDTATHKGAINTGKTIAVLGSGLLNIYPKENIELAHVIAENGAIVSEFPLLEIPRKENFPRRNRIVSGLSHGVLVVEAAQRSGALITAHCALEQNREVFALPGKINSPFSKGTHILIKEGAKLVDSVTDILEELNIETTNVQTDTDKVAIKLNNKERSIFDIIKR